MKNEKKGSNTNFDNNSQGEHDLKRPRLTSNDLKRTSNESVKKKRNKIRGGGAGKVQINGKDLIERVISFN